MPGRDISYTTRSNETFTGHLLEPDGDDKAPGILLITAIFGIDDGMKELSGAWAADGFIVSVPDIFWRVMPGPTNDMERAFARSKAFDVEQGFRDVEDLMGDLRVHPRCNGNVGVLGFCFGGRYAQVAAAMHAMHCGTTKSLASIAPSKQSHNVTTTLVRKRGKEDRLKKSRRVPSQRTPSNPTSMTLHATVGPSCELPISGISSPL